MRRVTLIGEDHGHTRYTLDIDPEKVRLKNRHTLLVTVPEWYGEDDGPDEEELDGMFLLRSWYDHDDEFLAALGIRIVEITERGKPLERAEPWEAGKIPLPDDLSSAVPLTQELTDGTVRKVMVRVPDFRQVRP